MLRNALQLLVVAMVIVEAVIRIPGEIDRRHINIKELEKIGKYFYKNDIFSYNTLLQDIENNQIYVGARNSFLRLDNNDLSELETVIWEGDKQMTINCRYKTSAENCYNYIRMIIKHGDHLLLCGTMYTFPMLTYRNISQLSVTTKTYQNNEICGSNLFTPITNIVLKESLNEKANYMELYAGSKYFDNGDMMEKSIFSRLEINTDTLHTSRDSTHTKYEYKSKWINDGMFASSYEIDNHIYFIFNERSSETDKCNDLTNSETDNTVTFIARVCKNDASLKNFQSYAKLRLNCLSMNKFSQKSYNIVNSTAYSSSSSTIYMVMKTWDSDKQVVCSYNMTEIKERFRVNRYTYWNTNTGSISKNTKHRNTNPSRDCGNERFSNDNSEAVREQNYLYLLNQHITSETILESSDPQVFTNIMVDTLRTRTKRGHTDVLFISEIDGNVYKYRVDGDAVCYLEAWQVAGKGVRIHNMQFSLDSPKSLYVLTDNRVWKLNLHNCESSTKKNCLMNRDPYCGWNNSTQSCTSESKVTNYLQENSKYKNKKQFSDTWIQNNDERCNEIMIKVDGGWSDPYDEQACDVSSESHAVRMVNCTCSNRKCNNPTPIYDGKQCEGSAAVISCKVDSRWTKWSQWSSCTQTCQTKDFASKQIRSRSCLADSNDLRSCRGDSFEMKICESLPACPAYLHTDIGKLSQWSRWSACSVTCGGVQGVQARRRTCVYQGRHDYWKCIGDRNEMRVCFSSQKCITKQNISLWTEWHEDGSPSSNTGSMYTMVRYRSKCAVYNDKLVPSIHRISKICYYGRDKQCEPIKGVELMKKHIPVKDPFIEIYKGWSDWTDCKCIGYKWRVKPCANMLQCDEQKQPREIVSCTPKYNCYQIMNEIRTGSLTHKEQCANPFVKIVLYSLVAFFIGGAICTGIFICFQNKSEKRDRYYGSLSKSSDTPPYSSANPNKGRDLFQLHDDATTTHTMENIYGKPPGRMTVDQAAIKRDTLLRHSSSRNSPSATLLKAKLNWKDNEDI